MSCSIVIIYAVSNWFSHLGPSNQPLTFILPTKKIFKSQVGQLGNGKFKFTPLHVHTCSQQMVRDPLVWLYKDLSKRSIGLFGVCTVRLVGRAHSGQRVPRVGTPFGTHRPTSKLATLQDISRWPWRRGRTLGIKEMNQPPATWQPRLYLECYIIMHCKLGLSPLVDGS